MKTQLIHEHHGEKTFVLVFDKGEEAVAGLQEFAARHDITAAHLTAVGAFREVTLGYFDRDRKEYKRIPLREQVEVLALIGNIALAKGQPKLHAHVVVGKSDGTAHGGHLLEAQVWPTLEVVVVESPHYLHRTLDQETGLALLQAHLLVGAGLFLGPGFVGGANFGGVLRVGILPAGDRLLFYLAKLARCGQFFVVFPHFFVTHATVLSDLSVALVVAEFMK